MTQISIGIHRQVVMSEDDLKRDEMHSLSAQKKFTRVLARSLIRELDVAELKKVGGGGGAELMCAKVNDYSDIGPVQY